MGGKGGGEGTRENNRTGKGEGVFRTELLVEGEGGERRKEREASSNMREWRGRRENAKGGGHEPIPRGGRRREEWQMVLGNG